MDDENTPKPKPKLRLVTPAEARAICAAMPRRTAEEALADADRHYEMSDFRKMTPEQEAKARGMGPELVERIREARECNERGIKARRERRTAGADTRASGTRPAAL